MNESILPELEKTIDEQVLNQFKELFNNKLEWNCDIVYLGLFDTWCKIKNKSLGTVPMVNENIEEANVDLSNGTYTIYFYKIDLLCF